MNGKPAGNAGIRGVAVAGTGFNKGVSMGISWDWKEADRKKLFGSQAYETDMDFESKSKARDAINAMFLSYECKGCGSHDLSGGNILIEITFISLYREVTKKGFFGGEKWVEEHWKDVWRVGDGMIFKSGGVFGGAGYIKCNKCKEKASAGGFWGQWAANIAEGKRRGDF